MRQELHPASRAVAGLFAHDFACIGRVALADQVVVVAQRPELSSRMMFSIDVDPGEEEEL